MRLKDFLAQVAAVGVEHRVCGVAVARLRKDVENDPTIGRRLNLKRAEMAGTMRRLEHTYVVRVFAVFEACLRELWENSFHRKTEPPVRDLINSTAAANAFMPPSCLKRVHQIREYRNSIVHLNATASTEFSMAGCLEYFEDFSFLHAADVVIR